MASGQGNSQPSQETLDRIDRQEKPEAPRKRTSPTKGKNRPITKERLLARYTAKDRERICLEAVDIPSCGGAYLCQLAKGHENGDDPKLKKHQAACREHHCCVIQWTGARAEEVDSGR